MFWWHLHIQFTSTVLSLFYSKWDFSPHLPLWSAWHRRLTRTRRALLSWNRELQRLKNASFSCSSVATGQNSVIFTRRSTPAWRAIIHRWSNSGKMLVDWAILMVMLMMDSSNFRKPPIIKWNKMKTIWMWHRCFCVNWDKTTAHWMSPFKRSCQRLHAAVVITSHHADATLKSAHFHLYCSAQVLISKMLCARLTLAISRQLLEVGVFPLELEVAWFKHPHRVLYRSVVRPIPRQSRCITSQRITLSKALPDYQVSCG